MAHLAAEVVECRICHDDQETDLSGPLFTPCLCNGTQALVHRECLETWRRQQERLGGIGQSKRCELCHYEYRFGRHFWQRILASRYSVHVCTLITVVSIVLVVAYALKYVAYLVLGLKLTRRSMALTGRLVWYSILVIGFVTMLITLLVLIFGDNRNNGVAEAIHFGHWYGGPWNGPWHGPGPGVFDSPAALESLFDMLGYVFSLSGFLVFIKYCYMMIETQIELVLRKTGVMILEYR